MGLKAASCAFAINNPFLLVLRFSSSSSSAHPVQGSGDLHACVAILQACARRRSLGEGRRLHSWILVNGFMCSPFSVTSLIHMYSKCHRITDAIAVFESLPGHERQVSAWNAIIAAFVANGRAQDGFLFYRRMRRASVVPDKFTYSCVIRAFCDASVATEIEKIHGEVLKYGLEFEPFIGSALVSSYLEIGLMNHAHEVFEQLPTRDVVLYNAMIHGYAHRGEPLMALEVFGRMGEDGLVPNRFTVTGVLSVLAVTGGLGNGRTIHGFGVKTGCDSELEVSNSLIDMYGKSGRIPDAVRIFDLMAERDVFSWNSIICVLEHSGDHHGTLKLFDRMLGAGVQPDQVTMVTVLPACAHLAALRHGREIHGQMIVGGLGIETASNAVMDMYAKCGSMRDACQVFDGMSHRDLVSWNTLIMGYGIHGHGERALDVFSRMLAERVRPDEITFVGLLSACSHAGLVGCGRELLEGMEASHGVAPTREHYACVVDMLCRAGLLREAYELVLGGGGGGGPVVWRALLWACGLHGDAPLAKVVAREAFRLDPGHCGNYVLASKVHEQVGEYGEASEVRREMRRREVRKMPGWSWIEVGAGVHVFATADRTQPQSPAIYVMLDSLTALLRELGYVPGGGRS